MREELASLDAVVQNQRRRISEQNAEINEQAREISDAVQRGDIVNNTWSAILSTLWRPTRGGSRSGSGPSGDPAPDV